MITDPVVIGAIISLVITILVIGVIAFNVIKNIDKKDDE